MAIRTGTIWDTLANAGSGAVAELVLRSHHEPADPQVPDGEQVLVVDEVRTLDRVGHLPGDSDWLRPVMLATLAARLAPRAAGAANYPEGWVLLERLDAPAGGIPAGKRLGPAREVPVVDLGAGTATWYTIEDAPLVPLAELAAGKRAAATAAFRSARDAGTTVELAPGVSIVVSTTRAAAVELSEGIEEITANGPMTVVTRARAVVALNLAAAGAMLAGIRAHVRLCQEQEAAHYTAIAAALAAEDRAALLAIDPEAGYPAAPG